MLVNDFDDNGDDNGDDDNDDDDNDGDDDDDDDPCWLAGYHGKVACLSVTLSWADDEIKIFAPLLQTRLLCLFYLVFCILYF